MAYLPISPDALDALLQNNDDLDALLNNPNTTYFKT